MSGRLQGKTVMVTGAGTGFGATLAEAAARPARRRRSSRATSPSGTRSSGWPRRPETSTCSSTTWATWPPRSTRGHGLLGITKSYAKALAPQVRVNTFAPGFMDTPAVMAMQDSPISRAVYYRFDAGNGTGFALASDDGTLTKAGRAFQAVGSRATGSTTATT